MTRSEAPRAPRWPVLISPSYDLRWFIGPGVLSLLLGVAWLALRGRESQEDLGLLGWVLAVLLIDVTHVYATLFRTYFDPQARVRHRRRLWAAPALCLWFGALVHLASPLAFWSVLAYLAIFHFIKQHEGFAYLYLRAEGKAPDAAARRKRVRAAIWTGLGGPVLWWHTQLPRDFAWFMQGDLLAAPDFLTPWAPLLLVPQLIAALVFLLPELRRGLPNPLLVAVVLLPIANWNLGIVLCNDDRIFTLTNVLFHGIPYLALVWVTGARQGLETRFGARRPRWVLATLPYYALLASFAFAEEFAWDRWVWHERPEIFGFSEGTAGDALSQAVLVSLLTLPQATHYLLDRYIWRFDATNPELSEQLSP